MSIEDQESTDESNRVDNNNNNNNNYKSNNGAPLHDHQSEGVEKVSQREAEPIVDPLLANLPALPTADDGLSLLSQESSSLSMAQRITHALITEGYYVLPGVLNESECQAAVDCLWDFVMDTSYGRVQRSDPTTWYPPPASATTIEARSGNDQNEATDDDDDDVDPWPWTGYKSFPDMFQSNGAGFLLGHLRETLAERVFEPLFGTRELHTSKEGFTFHRPLRPQDVVIAGSGDNNNNQNYSGFLPQERRVCAQVQHLSLGEHYDQSSSQHGLTTIQSLTALEDQVPDVDGCFLCWPRSFGHVHQALTKNTYRGKFAWIPLTDAEIERLQGEFGLQPQRIYLRKGDVLLWRSDLVHAALSPTAVSPRFRIVSYCSMQPAKMTTTMTTIRKMDAYKERRTGDHRPHEESWHAHRRSSGIHRCYFRTGPPLVTERLAELYGLLPYPSNNNANTKQKEEERAQAIQRAIIRGVRFLPEDGTNTAWRNPSTWLPLERNLLGSAHLEILHADPEFKNDMEGTDKWLGGMASPCGRFIYGVPGTARRVLRIHTATGRMDCIGPEFTGKFKWLRGVEVPPKNPDYPSGCCLALPCNHPSVLKINPHTNEVYAFGQDVLKNCGATNWLYHGGNLASNGWIYAIPANADRVVKFHPFTDEICFIGPKFEGKAKWYGGIVGSDGCIWGIPHNHSMVLRIDPNTDEISLLGLSSNNADTSCDSRRPLPEGKWKWHGGLRAGHKIIGFPNNSDSVLVIDCSNHRIYTIGDSSVLRSGRHRIPQDNRYKYLGGALTQDGRYAFLFPCDAEQVLCVDCVEDKVLLVGPLLLEGENKFQNGFVGRDGALYGIPQRSCGVLRIVPKGNNDRIDEDFVEIMDCGEDLVGVKDKFEGGVMGRDGCIYCVPLRATTCVKIVP